MSILKAVEMKRWILGVAAGFLIALMPLGVFAGGAKGTVWVANE